MPPMTPLESLSPEEIKHYNLPQRRSISKGILQSPKAKEMDVTEPNEPTASLFSENEARREMARSER